MIRVNLFLSVLIILLYSFPAVDAQHDWLKYFQGCKKSHGDAQPVNFNFSGNTLKLLWNVASTHIKLVILIKLIFLAFVKLRTFNLNFYQGNVKAHEAESHENKILFTAVHIKFFYWTIFLFIVNLLNWVSCLLSQVMLLNFFL